MAATRHSPSASAYGLTDGAASSASHLTGITRREDFFGGFSGRKRSSSASYPLVMTNIAMTNIPIEIDDLPIKDGDFP